MKDVLFYTPAQVAKMMQLNIVTIYYYIRTKELPAIKLGRSYRIEKKDLDAFIKKHKNK